MSRRTLALWIWLLSDLALFIASFVLAYFLRVGFIFSSDFPFKQFLSIAALAAIPWLVMLILLRTFSLMRRQQSLRVGAYLLVSAIVATSLFALSYFFIFGLFFSRLLLIYALALSWVLPWAWHMAWEQIMRAWLRIGTPMYPTLIIGATREAAHLIRLLQSQKSPLAPVAILDGRGTKETSLEGVPVAGKLHKLDETIEKLRITHLIQCSDLEQSINLLSACRAKGITYLLLPSVLGIIEGDEKIESLEGQPVTAIHPPEAWWKWFFN